MTPEDIRKLVAELDEKAGQALEALQGEGREVNYDLISTLEQLQFDISDWQEKKGYI